MIYTIPKHTAPPPPRPRAFSRAPHPPPDSESRRHIIIFLILSSFCSVFQVILCSPDAAQPDTGEARSQPHPPSFSSHFTAFQVISQPFKSFYSLSSHFSAHFAACLASGFLGPRTPRRSPPSRAPPPPIEFNEY